MFSFLFYLFLFVVILQAGFYTVLLGKFSLVKKKATKPNEYAVSVIVACRNETENLAVIIPKLLIQDHPKFEIILIDDASTDDTWPVMQAFANKEDKITVSSISASKSYQGNKKNALTHAIKLANFEHLLFTDADCIPNSDFWITEMSQNFNEQKEIVLGYGGYQKISGWLNKLVRFETLLTAWQYFSYALIGKSYMGVGRNIAYSKSLFQQQNGFINHQEIKSGDDDLFVNEAATTTNVAICWHSNSHTTSSPKTSLSSWIQQKRRHITTATTYKPIHQFLLGLFYISQVLFYGLFFILLFNTSTIKLVIILASIRYVFYFFSLIPTANKLNENDLIVYAPFLELILIVLQLRIFISNLLKKPVAW